MAKAKTTSSKELKDVLVRVKKSGLSRADKVILAGILSQAIRLRELVERSTVARGKKRVVASLPFGFDIVK
jgi:hypothetical protein